MKLSSRSVDDFGIERDDVPYLSRSWAIMIQMAVTVIVWIVEWWSVAEYRPGVIEAMIGFVFAFPVGILYARSAIAQARASAANSRQQAGPSLFAFSPESGVAEYFIAVSGAFLACLLLVGVVYAVSLVMSGQGLPWARFDHLGISRYESLGTEPPPLENFPYISVIAASTTYFFVNMLVVQHRMLIWYQSLPFRSSK